MPINPDAVGSESGPSERSWTSKEVMLYAVSVGCGVDELQFTVENARGIDLQTLPTFATIIGGGAGGGMRNIGSFNPAMLVHGEQGIELSGVIPTEGKIKTTGKIVGIWDKGSGAVIQTEATSVDAQTDELIFKTRSSTFIRGEGGFGGERGPSGPRNVPPDREPDKVINYETLPSQALLYRLNGDRNPLHVDPEFAKIGGFDRPIIHGLCSYGFTGRALLHGLCDGDPKRFGSMDARFSKPAWPGDTYTVKMWLENDHAIFRTETQRGDVVIDQGKFTWQ